jgi:carboxypeptidase C (cathepsin A)
VAFNGAVMVSSYLNAYHDFAGPAYSSDVPYALYLPTMAASAWYHDKVQPKPPALAPFIDEVRQFALNDYMHALAQGNRLPAAERDAIVTKLAHYTGMPETLLRNSNLRLTPDRFQKELLRGEQRTIGRLDARFEGIDHDAGGESPESDASSDAFEGAFVGAFNSYVRSDLAYESGDELYRPTNYGEVNRDWDNGHGGGPFGKAPMPDVAEDLRQALSANPHLKIFFANGYYDFATPFFETEYTVGHMGLDPALEKNLTWGYYEAGHMMYIHPPARTQLKADLSKFYDQALKR